MQIWALFWHIRTMTHHPIALGGIGLARILPVIFFSLVGGAVADSYNRRRVLFVTQISAALVALTLGLLTEFGHISLWHIYALTALQAVAVAFDGPARQALIPNLVPARDLPNAFSLTSIAFQAGAVIGPALSGFVIVLAGQQGVYYINAASFLAVILALVLIGDVPQKRSAQANGVTWPAIREGVRFIAARPIILGSMLLDFVATFFASANTLMPIIARDILQVGVVGYGWLSAAQSVGAVVAALIISQVQALRRQGPLFLWAVLVFGAGTIFFGLARSFVLAWVLLAIIGAADAVSTIIRNTIRQLQTPDHLRGRMTSVNQIFFQGGPQLGEIEAGCIVGLGLIVAKWPQLMSYDEHEPGLAGAPAALPAPPE
jgi:MFS family permease